METRSEMMTVEVDGHRIQTTTRAYPNLALYAKLRRFQDDFSAEFLGKVSKELAELTTTHKKIYGGE